MQEESIAHHNSRRLRSVSDMLIYMGLFWTAVWTVIAILLGSKIGIFAASTAFTGFAFAYFMFRRGLWFSASLVWLISTNVAIFISTFSAHPDSKLDVIFFGMAGLPFLLFYLNRNLSMIIVLAALPVVLWMVRFMLGVDIIETYDVGAEVAGTYVAPLSVIMTFIIVIYQVAYFAIVTGRFAKHLEHARRDAEQSNRAKTVFLSGISHELRTPLNGVIGLADVIRHTAVSRGDVQLAGYATQINAAGNDLLGTVEKTVHFADLAARRAPVGRAPVVLANVVGRVIEAYEREAIQNHIVIHTERLDVEVLADASLLQDCIAQVVENAIRYAGHGSHVWISTAEASPKTRHISVRDNGRGFGNSDPDLAFQPFERLERASGTTFGAGMGLSIARIKAEAMGGSILMRNLAEGGAEAIITLPIPEADTTTTHADGTTPLAAP